MRSIKNAIQRSLFLKFILVYVLFGLMCFGIVALFSSRFSYRQSIANGSVELSREADILAESYAELYSSGTLPTDFEIKVSGLAEYTDQRIWFIGTDGHITYDSRSGSGSLLNSVIENFDPAEFRSRYTTGRFYNIFAVPMLSVLAPVTYNFRTYGYVVVHVPLSSIALDGDRALIPIYLTVAIVYVLSLLILILIWLMVLRPVRKITQGAKEFAEGNLKYNIKVHSEDEFGYLADTLNVMGHELNAAEENQRRFIANVSHDFRSPLTSIKGYLEAMIDGVIPPELQEKYMRVVINETERLTNLTQSMLSLNSLERKNIHLEYSDFDICQMIKNVCATFEVKCLGRNISIDLVLTSSAVMVHADMGKIQQVIYNLLDNAIKFSHDNSSIRIQVTRRRDRIFISVKDQGVGIPRENIKQIWTRFFKTDESRGKDKRGTGLGLSIVREIIQAHGETIDVISTEGVGTEFIFRLPAAQDPDNDNWLSV